MRHTTEEFLDLVKNYPITICGKSDFMYPSKIMFMGKICCIVPEGVVWFDVCKYCGSTDLQIYKNLLEQDCCVHCNAPVLWNNY